MTLELALKNGSRVSVDELTEFTVADRDGDDVARFEVTDGDFKITWVDPRIGLQELAEWTATLHPQLRKNWKREALTGRWMTYWFCSGCRRSSKDIFHLVGRPCDPPS